jgi:pyruvate formate lyase activating enzyme
MDSELHKKYTGAGNERILSNLIRTVGLSVPLIVRIPVVPDHNNDEKNIRETAKFILHELNNEVLQVQLLPYRQLGLEKYESMGLPYPMGSYTPPERSVWEENIKHLVTVMKGYGVPAVAGSTVKI